MFLKQLKKHINVLWNFFCSAPTEKVYTFDAPRDELLQEGLARNGFTCNGDICTPCQFGTYQTRASDGSYVCAKCPPGIVRRTKPGFESHSRLIHSVSTFSRYSKVEQAITLTTSDS